MFLRYVAWLKIVLVHRGVDPDDIAESLRCMASALIDDAAGDHSIAASYVQTALEQLDSMPDCGSELYRSAERGPHRRAAMPGGAASPRRLRGRARYWSNAVAAGMPLARIYTGVLPPLMREIGRLWQMNEISVAHEHYCSAAVQSILGGFYGRMFGGTTPSGRSMLVACVEGEQHELGARTVADVFELNGWRTSFLGANLPSRDLVTLIRQARRPPDLIALSATMPAHLSQLASTIAAIREGSNIPVLVPIMVGGYLFDGSPSLAARLGADGCADDAEAALAIANALVAQPA